MINENSLRVLSFDPGESTGISFVIDRVFVWGMVTEASSFQSESFLLGLMKMSNPTIVIIEIPPTSGKFYNKIQTDIYTYVLRWFMMAGIKVQTISPGQWKHLVKRSTFDSTHVKDATDMAVWFSGIEMRARNAQGT